MKKILIILVTYNSYLNTCKIFLELFKKNWSDCKYELKLVVIGNRTHDYQNDTIYYGENCSLPGAIYKTMYGSDYEYCISFLGDAFINDCIDSNVIDDFINEIVEKNIKYCCLIPRISFRFKCKTVKKYTRYISYDDTYNMSFVAFVASRDFILQEFKNNITDEEFELKYLSNDDFNKGYYNDRAILRKNIFHIVPGIDAGKWNRRSIRKLMRKNKKIKLERREKVPIINSIQNDISLIFQIFLSRRQRKVIKRIMERIFKLHFVSKY